MTKPDKPKRIYAFIDGQNIHQVTQSHFWKHNPPNLQKYLHNKHGVTHAFFFLAHRPNMQSLYRSLENAGFILEYREVVPKRGKPKSNIDVNLAVFAALHIDDYDHAVLLSADGDFYPLIEYWRKMGKTSHVLSPATKGKTSHLLKKHAGNNITYMTDSLHQLQAKFIKKPRRK